MKKIIILLFIFLAHCSTSKSNSNGIVQSTVVSMKYHSDGSVALLTGNNQTVMLSRDIIDSIVERRLKHLEEACR